MQHNNAAGDTVYIGNLPYDSRKEELETLCSKWGGTVLNVTIVYDKYVVFHFFCPSNPTQEKQTNLVDLHSYSFHLQMKQLLLSRN